MKISPEGPSAAILVQAISCSNVHGAFPVQERFRFCLVQVSTTQFCSFPSFLMAHASDGTNVPISPAPASSSNLGFPKGSLPDLEGTGFRASTMEEKINEIYLRLPLFTQTRQGLKIASRRLLRQWPPRQLRLQILNKLLGALWFASLLWKRMQLVVPVALWNMLGHSSGSTATGSLGSHGPGTSDDSRNTRRRLETFSSPEDEHARSAVSLRFPF